VTYPPAVRHEYLRLSSIGVPDAQIATKLQVSRSTIAAWKRNFKDPEKGAFRNGQEWRNQNSAEQHAVDPVAADRLPPNAARALEDFGYFRWRYFGRRATAWQEEAAYTIKDLLESPNREFAVLNCPPGTGKTTTFTHDIPTWLICRDRTIRELLGHATQRNATAYSRHVRNTLSRVRPLTNDAGQQSEGILAADYGRFKPANGDLWRAEEFVVAQFNDDFLDDKEPTCAAFGRESETIGHRANLVVWDDLVTKAILRNAEQIDAQREWWVDVAEKRLEPAGLLLLQGQRLGPEDLYRYCLDMPDVTELEGDDFTEEQLAQAPKKYIHIVYPAHVEKLCKGGDHKDAEGYPNGCILDPVRLPWRDIRREERNNLNYRTVYQQEDINPAAVLVPKLWVDGGVDPATGEHFQGCWDRDRGLAEIPRGLAPPVLSIATADPSPTKFWAIEWWLVHPLSNQHFLLDLIRQSMDAPDFLDWNQNGGVFSGIMDEWQTRSEQMGAPITHWVVENNAAQRFMLQYDHVHRWRRKRGVTIIPHATHLNKVNPDYGVETVKNLYRYGQVRLPGLQNRNGVRDPGRLAAMKLVDEVTRYPESRTDDCLMAQWFLTYNLPGLIRAQVPDVVQQRRPSWLKKRVAA
jgi:hypothetical protein